MEETDQPQTTGSKRRHILMCPRAGFDIRSATGPPPHRISLYQLAMNNLIICLALIGTCAVVNASFPNDECKDTLLPGFCKFLRQDKPTRNEDLRILYRTMPTLRLSAHKQADRAHGDPTPQVVYTGPPMVIPWSPIFIVCENVRHDEKRYVEWECSSPDLVELLQLANVVVRCEGWDASDDHYIRDGSCMVYYTLELKEGYDDPEEKEEESPFILRLFEENQSEREEREERQHYHNTLFTCVFFGASMTMILGFLFLCATFDGDVRATVTACVKVNAFIETLVNEHEERTESEMAAVVKAVCSKRQKRKESEEEETAPTDRAAVPTSDITTILPLPAFPCSECQRHPAEYLCQVDSCTSNEKLCVSCATMRRGTVMCVACSKK